jgi:hypothetical protein
MTAIQPPKRLFLGSNITSAHCQGLDGSGLSGERGGPVFSAEPFSVSALFNEVKTTSGVPYVSFDPFPNRVGCSSFIAAKDGKVWINASQGAFRPSGFFSNYDWEYQTRIYLGNPNTDPSLSASVNRKNTRYLNTGTVPNSGSWGVEAFAPDFDYAITLLPSP